MRGLGRLVVSLSLAFAGAALSATACKGDDPPPSTGVAPPAQGQARAGFTLEAEGGGSWSSAEPSESGFTLRGTDGSKRGKIKIEADRVKVKDEAGTTAGKAKLKDYGFKLYQGDDTDVAKVKRKGAGYKVSDPEGTELAVLNTDGPGGTASGTAITVESTEGKVVVKRGGQAVGTFGASVQPEAAAFLALTELPFATRVAAVVYVQEHAP